MIIKLYIVLKYKYFILTILLIQIFLIIIANPNIFKVTNYVTFINYTYVFITNFTTGFALHIQLFAFCTYSKLP